MEVIMLQKHHTGLHSAVISLLGAMILVAIALFYPTTSFAQQQCTAQMISVQACLDQDEAFKCNNPSFPGYGCTLWTNPGNGAPGWCMTMPAPNTGELVNCGMCWSPDFDPCCGSTDLCCGSKDPCCGSCDECCRQSKGGNGTGKGNSNGGS